MLLPLGRLMSFTVRSFDAPLARSQVQISLSAAFNRVPHPSTDVERQVVDNWNALQQQQPSLFNASKFRLQNLHESPRGLRLQWGLTDYATYLGTCCSTKVQRLLADGEALAGDKFAFLSRKVGVAAVLETQDAHVALIKRSKSVGLYQDLYDTPGGHPEPEHIGLTRQRLESMQDEDKREMEEKAVDEFFVSIVNEVHEEVNLLPEKQQQPMLLGVVLQSEACTPSFSFHIKTACTAEELRELYRAGPPDKFESVKLELLEVDNLLTGKTPLDTLNLTPSAQGTLGLWKEHTLRARQQKNWHDS